MKTGVVILALFSLLAAGRNAAAAPGHCAICAKPIERRFYIWEDKIAGDKQHTCEACSVLPACYMCGVPTGDNRTLLADQRVLCARDVKLAVLDEAQAIQICHDIKAELGRHFSRFTTFPETNVAVSVVDRINLIALFKVPGHDFGCPNILGYVSPETNAAGRVYHIRLMSGLTQPVLKATCAHEFGHTWIFENVAPARQASLKAEAKEGFCELVSYLLMAAQGETTATALIRSNGYTRGQVDLFLKAEHRFDFNEILAWMKSGEDPVLRADDLTRVRRLLTPERTNPPAPPIFTALAVAPPAPDRLSLQGILWSKKRPMPTINGRTFQVNEEGKVRLEASNVTVRCLAIREQEVEIQLNGANERQPLRLGNR